MKNNNNNHSCKRYTYRIGDFLADDIKNQYKNQNQNKNDPYALSGDIRRTNITP